MKVPFEVEHQRTTSASSNQRRATGQTGIIIVNFHPWGAAPFFRFPLDELTDAFLEMNLVMRTDTVENRVQEASGTAARVEIIQDFLAGHLADYFGKRRQLKKTSASSA